MLAYRSHLKFFSSLTLLIAGVSSFLAVSVCSAEGIGVFAKGVNAVAFSPDGRYLLSGGNDANLTLWDVSTGNIVKVLEGHSDVVTSVAYGPKGKYAASGSWDKSVGLWDIQAGRLLKKMTKRGHKGRVNAVAISPDGKQIMSGSTDTRVMIWDIEDEEFVRAFKGGHTKAVKAVAFSPDGSHAITGGDDTSEQYWRVYTGIAEKVAHNLHCPVTAVGFAPNGEESFVGGSWSPLIVRNNIDNGTDPRGVYTGHSNDVTALKVLPYGDKLITASKDKTLMLWDIPSQQVLRVFRGHTDWVTSVDVSSDGRLAASGSRDGTIRIWDIATGKELKVLKR